MKLKEKLAEDWEEQEQGTQRGYGIHFYDKKAFLAGFEKAREMAFEIADEYSHREGTKGPSIEVAVNIKTLGEEEV